MSFSPAMPIPLTIDIPARIATLRGYLDPSNPDYQPEGQHVNIRAAIKLYEDGTIDGTRHVMITDGKVVTLQEASKSTSWSWGEVCFIVLTRVHYALISQRVL